MLNLFEVVKEFKPKKKFKLVEVKKELIDNNTLAVVIEEYPRIF